MENARNRRSRKFKIWPRALMAAGAVLVSVFLYQTCQMYMDRRAAAEKVSQWRLGQSPEPAVPVDGRLKYKEKVYRRNTYVKAVLLMGIDRQGSLEKAMVAGSGGQADAIFLVALDTARDRARVLVIPRDTMTEITMTDLSGNILGEGIQHINLAYAYGDGREKSCRYMADAVSGLLGGLSMDGYMAVSMSVLPLLNDRAGGVTVTIEEPGLERANPCFLHGKTITLDGKQAEGYVRYRDTDQAQSALARTERQKSYINGFLHAAGERSAKDDGFVPVLMKEIEPYMVTDMTKDRYMDMALAFLSGGQEFEETDMVTLPGTAVETSLYDEYHPDQEGIMPIVLDLFYREE